MHQQGCPRRGLGQLLGYVTLLAFAGCATRSVTAPRSLKSAQAGSDIALFALSLFDMPYVSVGRGPATGFDCSGVISHVYLQGAGIRRQGSAASMSKTMRPVSATELVAGDLVFFNTLGYSFSHVGIYVGDGRFVHASNPRTGVRTDRLDSKYYAARFEGANTVLG